MNVLNCFRCHVMLGFQQSNTNIIPSLWTSFKSLTVIRLLYNCSNSSSQLTYLLSSTFFCNKFVISKTFTQWTENHLFLCCYTTMFLFDTCVKPVFNILRNEFQMRPNFLFFSHLCKTFFGKAQHSHNYIIR